MKRIILILLTILLISSGISALEVENPVLRGGMLFLGSSEPSAAPSPLLTTFGVSVPLRFSEFLLLDPALYLYGTWYGFSGTSSRPVPFPSEWREAWVLSVLIDPAFRAELSLGERTAAGVSVSSGLLFRFPVIVYEGETFDSAAALGHFFSSGRFIFPKTGLYFSWGATDNLTLRAALDAWFPLYHAWDGGSEPFWDDLVVCGWIGIQKKTR